MIDYNSRMDADLRQHLQIRDSFGTLGADADLTAQRQQYAAVCQHFEPELPSDVTVTDATIAGVPTRHYRCNPSASALVIYFHGGGFLLGNLDSHNNICADMCVQSELDVLAVDYRLTPDHLHPAQFNDALMVVDASLDDQPIILAGDSAGGTLAAAVSMQRRDKIKAQALMYPWLDIPGEHQSFRDHAHAPVLTAADTIAFDALRHGDQPQPTDATYFPLLGDDFSDLPRCFISTAEFDPLKDEGQLYAQLINYSGGTAEIIEEKGLIHSHMRARHDVARATQAFATFTNALKILAQ